MIRTVLAALALATLPAVSHALPDYDRSIEQAAARIVAGKIGEIRGTIDPAAERLKAPALDRQPTGTVRSGWEAGLAPAVELRFVVPQVR